MPWSKARVAQCMTSRHSSETPLDGRSFALMVNPKGLHEIPLAA
jgi:hypothetical protein